MGTNDLDYNFVFELVHLNSNVLRLSPGNFAGTTAGRYIWRGSDTHCNPFLHSVLPFLVTLVNQ